MKAVASETAEELPHVVKEMRKRDRGTLLGLIMMLGIMGGCTYYLVSRISGW